ncbi:hypothetical protein [Sphingomonas nostoxanthinifaciens]|uniref:hypothetical protein n=1 Tax=Sphingomonas nostoxanthinifaciens TaxID=2872652 RepID=UPI001CC1D619|nr:hypothetical protein [Sphingomonas nostoxanthinifaciens]UAK23588.1 hypothetical protein K8P63_14495 [Sphingomonas nostoxanthinifaciens]
MRTVALTVSGLAALLLLAGCGDEQALTPRPGRHLPVKAATAPGVLNADELLLPSAHERPGRSDELLIKSQPRPDDRFDLPPR